MNLPVLIDSSQSAVSSNDVNLQEVYHIRLQSSLNFVNILFERLSGQHLMGEHFMDYLTIFTNEIQRLYFEIDQAIVQNREEESEGSKVMGRPRKNINIESIKDEYDIFRNWKIVAFRLGISTRTLRRRRAEFGLNISGISGPRNYFTNITNDQLCDVIREVLRETPDIVETLFIGALRSRSIYVQRSRIRDAIMEVDPINRALRRRVSIVRRTMDIENEMDRAQH